MSPVCFSLLVPTRDRVATATCLVEHVLRFLPDSFEVVIQDCGKQGELERALGDATADKRVRYAHAGKLVSMTDNWNLGLSRCRGEYVAILGDDDGVTPELPEVIRWMQRENIDALSGNINFTFYYWPGYPERAKAGTYQMHWYTGEVVVYETEELLRAAIEAYGHAEVRTMPCPYGAIVRRKFLDEMRARSGNTFNGFTPDIYAAFYLSTIIPRMHWVDYPIFVPGVCPLSNSAAAMTGGGIARHTSEFDGGDWFDIVPVGSLSQILSAEGMVRALHDSRRAELVSRVPWAEFYASCMANDRRFALKNLSRWWHASRSVLHMSRGARISALATAIARRAGGRAVPRLRRTLEPRLGKPPRRPYERFENVADTRQLVLRQADALRRQAVSTPWS